MINFLKIFEDGTKLITNAYCFPYHASVELWVKGQQRPAIQHDYIRFMYEMISKSYVTKSGTEGHSGRISYLPHHGIYYPNKLGYMS